MVYRLSTWVWPIKLSRVGDSCEGWKTKENRRMNFIILGATNAPII
jgi:hypothetical protein